MPPIPLVRRSLRRHPQTACDAIEDVAVEVGLESGRVLVLRYEVRGEVDRLRVPGGTLDPERLWAHTCFELFVAPISGEAYVEYNFSPTGQCTFFAFSSYRQRTSFTAIENRVSIATEPGALRLEARAAVPVELGDAARLSLTAVIEEAAGALSYWAMRHPAGRPDFHHRDGFFLELKLAPSPAIVDAPV